MKNTTLASAARAAAFLICCATAAPTLADGPAASAVSPDGRNEIRLWTEGGALTYSVVRDGRDLVSRSALSMRFAAQGDLAAAAKLAGVTERARSGRLPTPVGKKAYVDLAGNETLVSFDGGWAIRLAARNDGVAYRFETAFGGRAKVMDETADVRLAETSATAYVNRDRGGWKAGADSEQDSWEAITEVRTFADIATRRDVVYLPIVFKLADGTALCVTESDLHDYAGWLMTRDASRPDNPLVARFSRHPTKTINVNWSETDDRVKTPLRYRRVTERADYLVETDGTRTYPWRTFMISPRAVDLCANDLVEALATPPSGDFSWVKPGKVAWDWWNAWNNKGLKNGCTTAEYVRFIDFAAKNGVEYVIFDEGWSEKLNIWKYAAAVDVPYLIDYANGKGVGIILWMAYGQVYGQEEKVADYFGKLGAKGFKVDFMDREDADIHVFEEKFAAVCAKRKLLVDYHGMSKPAGLSVTYPNVLNFEGVHGLECMKTSDNRDYFPLNDLMQFYVRMSAGQMDYTPGAMDNYPVGGYAGTRENPGSISTRCRQMALMALYFAPLQMLSDAPVKYEREKACFDFMAQVPVTWDDTVGLDGDPTRYAVAARKKDGEWWCAGICSAEPMAYTLDTAFLGTGDWTAEGFVDAADAGRQPTHYCRYRRAFRAGAKLAFPMSPAGGFIVRLTPAPVTVRSPDGRNEIRLWHDPLAYEVVRGKTTVIPKTRIGLQLDGRCLCEERRDPVVTKAVRSGALKTPVYKKAQADLAANETFADYGTWGVRLVARNDGVAYRFETKKPGTVRVTGERLGVTLPSDALCTACRTSWQGGEETVGETKVAREVVTRDARGEKFVYLPICFTVGGKTAVFTEADVFDYPFGYLTRPEGSGEPVTLGGAFATWPTAFVNNDKARKSDGAARMRHWRVTKCADYLVETAGTRTYPWRACLLADDAAKICEADLVTALARPAAKKHDFSWVKPGKVAWDWWNAFDNIGDPEGCTTKTYERFIDFAAKNGVEYVIFDEGWSEKLNIWKFHPNVDVPHLIRYAAARNVGIILWMAWAQVQGDEDRVASHFAKLGAKGFKVDFMDRSDAEVTRFLWTFAEACRKTGMLIDYHGVCRPTGLSRAYPNVLNYEGIHGLEQMKFYRGQDIVGNDVRCVYTRMAAGPMDYTPGAMDNYAVGTYPVSSRGFDPKSPMCTNPGSIGTRARQMAMLALYEAPLQMLCESPTKYEKNAECFAFMAKTPVVWDATVGLGGTPETYAAIARKAKDGAWYAAAISNRDAREVAFDTSFLGAGEWQAEIFRDAPESAATASAYVHETRVVRAGERLSFKLAPAGGVVVRFAK